MKTSDSRNFLGHYQIQYNFSGSNTDGLFTTAISNSFLSPLSRKSHYCKSGLEKLTNANRSVSSENDRLFPVELTEIADWKSMSEYMLHSNFGKALTGVIGGNFCAFTFILPLPCFLNICLSFWMFSRRKEY